MEGWLKGLIATACMVVIIGGSYFAWGEYQAAQQRQSTQDEALRREKLLLERRMEALKFSRENCIQMAKATLPDSRGKPLKTDAHRDDIIKCDRLGRFDASWRQDLDFAGVL